MHVTSTDAFALTNSDLNAFLFAEVGTELNGSALTILSVLARLGEDPWVEAARWAKMPKSAAVDCLSQSIDKMPLGLLALADTSATASRLVLLLPLQNQAVENAGGETNHVPTARELVPMALFCVTLLFGIIFNIISVPVSHAGATAPIAQTVQHDVVAKSQQD